MPQIVGVEALDTRHAAGGRKTPLDADQPFSFVVTEHPGRSRAMLGAVP
jgi:hypothetical protein